MRPGVVICSICMSVLYITHVTIIKFTYLLTSKIAKPLTEMHPNTTIKNGKKVKTVTPFVWGKTQQEAFDQLKRLL